MAHPITSLWLFMMPKAQATTMVPLNLDQIVSASDTIVRGTVSEIWSEQDSRTGTIWTHAQVDISVVLKGDHITDKIIIEQPGGQYGHLGTIVEGVARFSIGEEGYFFIEELESDRNVTVGMFQGKYNVRLDPYSQEEIVIRFPVHPARDFDHRFIPLPEEQNRIFVKSFELEVLENVEAGWNNISIPGVSDQKLQLINTPKLNGGQ